MARKRNMYIYLEDRKRTFALSEFLTRWSINAAYFRPVTFLQLTACGPRGAIEQQSYAGSPGLNLSITEMV
jgi:hypothetical protein